MMTLDQGWTLVIGFGVLLTLAVMVFLAIKFYRVEEDLPFTDFSPVTPAEEADRREAGGI